MNGDMIFRIGVAVAAAALVVGTIAAVALRAGWKRLSAKLDCEYGPKRTSRD